MSIQSIERTKQLALHVGLSAEFIHHQQSGKTTEDAVVALGIDAGSIIKTLILHASKEDLFIAAVILGSDRLSCHMLASLAGVKSLRFASPEQIEKLTGFELGGVPPLAVKYCNRAFVDSLVVRKDSVVGAGGDDHCGMKFSPEDLLTRLPITVANISERSTQV